MTHGDPNGGPDRRPKDTWSNRLAYAIQLLQGGRLAEAESLLRLLQRQGMQEASLFAHLALLAGLRGSHGESIQLLEQALALRPDDPDSLTNLGVALRRCGDPATAAERHRLALELRPDFIQARFNLANALLDLGQLNDAIAEYRKVLAMEPGMATVHFNLGNAHKASGALEEALTSYREALALKPDYPEAQNNLGNALQEQGALKTAVEAYRQAIALRPDYADAHTNLGNVQRQQGLHEEALASYHTALRLRPDAAETHTNLGVALQEEGHLDEAFRCYERALAINPHYADAHINLGNAWQELGRLDAAIAAYDTALAVRPDHPEARWNRALSLLLAGRYEEGWVDYEARWMRKGGSPPLVEPPLPLWDGVENAGLQLLLVAEQGLGDTIQFMRYSQTLRTRMGGVSLCVPDKLEALVKASAVADQVLTPSSLGKCRAQAWMPLLTIAGVLGVSALNPIQAEPYIQIPKGRQKAWHHRIRSGRGLVVGINWQGNPRTETSSLKGRSLPLSTFAPLAEIEGVRLVSLQKGHGSEQLDTCPFREAFVPCQDVISRTWEFVEMAAVMHQCDVVISSDTAAAHLAGGLGIPTWLLLTAVPDWRWGLDGEDCPWYPSMRLFRQRTRGDWSEVMNRVAEALRTLARGVNCGGYGHPAGEVG